MRTTLFALMFSVGGVCLVAFLDSTVIFFLPVAVDAGLVLISARNPRWFWLYAILVSASSVAGTALTFYLGRRVGEAGLERFVSKRRLDSLKARVRQRGAVAIAFLGLIPPPFPFTAFALTAGAIDVDGMRFLVANFIFRLLRFGSEGLLAALYGPRIIKSIESELFDNFAYLFTFLIVAGSIVTSIRFFRRARAR